jgi:NADP-dependent 3-hydroxy acid dehydrogenase YdfG
VEDGRQTGTPVAALSGAVALITGASSGIGRELARTLAAEGAAVALAGRRGDRLQQLADEVAAGGGTALTLVADLADPADAGALAASTVAELGRLDVFVGCAGQLLPGPVSDSPAAEWERMIDVNLRGLLIAAAAALPALGSAAADSLRRAADLVLVGSTAGARAEHNLGVYGATKAAVAALAESLRRELAGSGVRVAHVAPGHTATELGDHGRPGIECGDGSPGTPPLRAAEVADAIRYLVTRPANVAISELAIRPAGQWV